MKPIFGIILMLSIFTLAGCATPAGDYEKASNINSIEGYKAFVEKYPNSFYTNEAKKKIAELTYREQKQTQIKNNWGKLTKGMSVDEVDSLLGPLNRAAVRSIKNLADNKNASSNASSSSNAEGGFPYRGHFFTLKFDATGRLSEWSLTD
jgi:hypothetical protein